MGINGKLYNDAIIGTEALNLQYAIQHVCYYMPANSSGRGRFNCIDGWFDFDIIKSLDDYCSGIVNGHTLSATYSFYRKPGADAVLKKLGSLDFTLTFDISCGATVNVNGTVITPAANGTVTVKCKNGIITGTSGTSIKGGMSGTPHSNEAHASVSGFKVELE